MGDKHHAVLVVAVVAVLLAVVGAEHGEGKQFLIRGPKTSVKIVNFLGGKNQALLKLHCQPNYKDIERQNIAPQNTFKFSFHPNFWGSSLIRCHFMWPGNSQHFDLYTDNRDVNRCPSHNCCWNIKPSGPCDCLSGKCYAWSPKSRT